MAWEDLEAIMAKMNKIHQQFGPEKPAPPSPGIIIRVLICG